MSSDIIPKISQTAQYGYNSGRTGTVESSISLPLKRIWKTDLSNPSGNHAPVTSGNTVIIPTLLEGFDILDVRSGKELGYVTTDGAVLGTPAISSTICYVPITGGPISLKAIEIESGALQWQAVGEPSENPVLLLNNRVVVTGMYGAVSCYGLNDSSRFWIKELPEPVLCAPSGHDTLVYIGCANGDIYALSLLDGDAVWRFPTGDALHATPVTDGSIVCVVNRSGTIVSLDAHTGTVLWRVDLGVPVFASAAMSEQLTVISGTDGIVRAYAKHDGAECWQLDIKTVPSGSILLLKEYFVVAGMDGRIIVASSATGEELWKDNVKGRIRTTPVINSGVICIITDDGTVYGYASN